MHIERNTKKQNRKHSFINRISLSSYFLFIVTVTVLVISLITIVTFVQVYREGMRSNAKTNTEQAVVQVKNTVLNYTEDMKTVMSMIQENMQESSSHEVFFEQFFQVRGDVVAVSVYDMQGNMLNCWSDGLQLKEQIIRNLSYEPDLSMQELESGEEYMHISKPHVESIFKLYHPWVVTFSSYMVDTKGIVMQVAVDIRFDNIAEFVDDVGIGRYGYCYIVNDKGEVVYHPQQQLIYYGLREENMEYDEDGTYSDEWKIWNIHSLENCDWRIVGVSYIDEMITGKLENTVYYLAAIMILILFIVIAISVVISKFFSRSANKLMNEMHDFENDADHYKFHEINGTSEIMVLSESFESLVIQIQRLVERTRQEEITLRKTELNALQAQINPHFLYNTLDAISWMCEEGKTHDAKEMVNALASLFRISISKGHELIPIAKEIEHAENYLKIQKYRYEDQFTYEFVVDKYCLDYYCNKITLQPIIENAIYHGIHRMVDEGHIRIVIASKDDDIVFVVEDNGVGMTKEKCNEILLHDSANKGGIGIKNVNDRIKIYFGEIYGITIDSEEDIGTSVTIRMPKVGEEEYAEK